MGRILKIKDAYFVEFLGNGLKFRKKAGATREEAEQKLAAIEESMRVTALDVDVSTVSIHLFQDRFLKYAFNVYPARTFKRLKRSLGQFVAWVVADLSSDAYLKEIVPRHFSAYQNHLESVWPAAKPAWINFELFLLETVFSHAIKLGWLNDNPLLHIRPRQEAVRRRPGIYTEDEMAELEGLLPDDQQPALALMRLAGLSLDEVSGLRWEDMDWTQPTIRISSGVAEGPESRLIPMDYRIRDVLESHRKRVSSDAEVVFDGLPFVAPINGRKLLNTFVADLIRRQVSLQDICQYLNLNDVIKIFPYRHFMTDLGDSLYVQS